LISIIVPKKPIDKTNGIEPIKENAKNTKKISDPITHN